jgi:hypothetical protein
MSGVALTRTEQTNGIPKDGVFTSYYTNVRIQIIIGAFV